MNQAFTEPNTTVLDLPLSETLPRDPDCERPHRLDDDSNIQIDGARQASILQLCSLKQINWAKDLLLTKNDHPGQTTTMVRFLMF